MVTLVVFLLVLVGGLISLATLPLVVSLPLMVVIGGFAILVIAELWRSYQELDSARMLDNVRVPSVVRQTAAPATGRELMGE
jgi:hypothetical protein